MKSFGAFGGMVFGLLDILLFYDGMVVLLVNAAMVFYIAGQHTIMCHESLRCVEVHLNRLLCTLSRREEQAVRLRNELGLELDGATEQFQAQRKKVASLENEVAQGKVLVTDLQSLITRIEKRPCPTLFGVDISKRNIISFVAAVSSGFVYGLWRYA